MRRRPMIARALLFLVPVTAPLAAGAQLWFEEVAVPMGLEFSHLRAVESSYRLPEIMSGGACWLDYDGDGDLDLYLVQGGALEPTERGEEPAGSPGNELFRNDGRGGFRRVTEVAGVGDRGYGMGCAVGDADGDGRVDLYVTNMGANTLYLNSETGVFKRGAADRGVDDAAWGASAAFADVDLDGDLDLFVANYLDWRPAAELDCFSGGLRDYCHPDRYSAPSPDRLFLNRGDATFEDGSLRAGLGRAFGNGLGVAVADLDDDGLPDIYVANDGMPNQLWMNRGDGRFEDVALLAGTAVNRSGSAEAGMGVQAFDVDADLDLDLFVAHLRGETNTLYLNDGSGLFEDATARRGLAAPSLGRTGFGIGFVDFDLDGNIDLFVANGKVGRGMTSGIEGEPFAEPDSLYRGLPEGHFETVDSVWVDDPSPSGASRSAAVGDFDDDGRVDIAVVESGGRLRLLRNRTAGAGRWTQALVLAPNGGPAVGSRVEAAWGGERRLRLVQPSYGYCGSNDPRVHFGVGRTSRLSSLGVTRPGGAEVLYRGVPTNHLLVLPARQR